MARVVTGVRAPLLPASRSRGAVLAELGAGLLEEPVELVGKVARGREGPFEGAARLDDVALVGQVALEEPVLQRLDLEADVVGGHLR